MRRFRRPPRSPWRPALRPALGCALILALAYLASPCVTLWRLDAELRHGDAAGLARTVDWPSVRAGLRLDAHAALSGLPATAQPPVADELPAFGSGMVSRIADNAIDAAVTPERIAAAMAPGLAHARAMRLEWACPTGLASFDAAFASPGAPPLRLRLNLAGGTWRITRVWLPDMLR